MGDFELLPEVGDDPRLVCFPRHGGAHLAFGFGHALAELVQRVLHPLDLLTEGCGRARESAGEGGDDGGLARRLILGGRGVHRATGRPLNPGGQDAPEAKGGQERDQALREGHADLVACGHAGS
ncbi:hypothetical protein D3C86_1736510 [compost metagenome]